jgi:hypothetical protein
MWNSGKQEQDRRDFPVSSVPEFHIKKGFRLPMILLAHYTSSVAKRSQARLRRMPSAKVTGGA